MTNTLIRYSDEDLAEFKALIEKKLEKEKDELDFMRDQIIELNENSGDQQGGDWFDDSSIHSELEMLNNQVIRKQQYVRNLENALVRIQNKTYGICSVTGQLIDKKRLLLVPHATKSVEAKEERPAPVPLIEKRDDLDEIKKTTETSKGPRIIDRVIRKVSTRPTTKPRVEDDDDFDWDELVDEIPVDDMSNDYDLAEEDYERIPTRDDNDDYDM
jgi:RNA polymerase-binding transcription factor DksA